MNNSVEKEQKKETAKTAEKKLPKCGIVMPISAIDTCSAEHWSEVLSIIKDSIGKAGFESNLVSDADDSGIIQKRIIHNLYSNEIVVCDVSAKNPNVMFELGMRLAFDKPTIIIKDDRTDYSFDTSIIEHLTYPRDLRFGKIEAFKEALRKKVLATYEKANKDENYTTFLKHFGKYKVAQLSEKEVTSEKYILSALDDLKYEMALIRRSQKTSLEAERDIVPPRRKRQIVNKYIEDYMKEHKIEKRESISIENKEELLYDYLTSIPEVRDICDGSLDLKEIMFSLVNLK